MQTIYKFLLKVSQFDVDTDDILELLQEITRKNMLDELFQRAYIHGILPLVFAQLSQHKAHIDANFYTALKNKNFHLMKTHMRMTSALLDINTVFNSHGIKLTAFKGPTLSQIIHNNIIYRQYTDLDILVPLSSLYEAAELLIKHNYLSDIDIKYLKNSTYLNIGKDLSFHNKEIDVTIELHWKLLTKKLIINEKNHFYRLQNITLNHQTLQTFDNETLLLYLSMHGSKHNFERIEWIVDIDRLLRACHNLDFELIMKESKELKITKLFLSALRICYTLFDSPLPSNIQKLILSDKGVINLANDMIQSIYNDALSHISSKPIDIQSIEDTAKLYATSKERLKYKLHAYLEIKESDITLINLPHSLSWFYYILRPIRILLKYLK